MKFHRKIVVSAWKEIFFVEYIKNHLHIMKMVLNSINYLIRIFFY